MNAKSWLLAGALLLAATLPATAAEPLSTSRLTELRGQIETALRAAENPANVSVIIPARGRLGPAGLPVGWNTVTISYCWEYQVAGGPDVIDMVDTEGDNFFTSDPVKVGVVASICAGAHLPTVTIDNFGPDPTLGILDWGGLLFSHP